MDRKMFTIKYNQGRYEQIKSQYKITKRKRFYYRLILLHFCFCPSHLLPPITFSDLEIVVNISSFYYA